MKVVFEALSKAREDTIESHLAGMRKGRMADVMRQSQSLGEIFVNSKYTGGSAGELGYFEGMCEAIAKVVGDPSREDLRFGFEAAESA
jgi:hypothetical protein